MMATTSRPALALTGAEVARFWAKVAPADGNGCWLWTASVANHGYGQMGVGGTVMLAHRISYQLRHGALTPGLTLDHLCHVKRCVNPDHLEEVTAAENSLRAYRDGLRPPQLRRTHCLKGHPLDEANTYVNRRSGERRCRACAQARVRAYRERLRPAGGAA